MCLAGTTVAISQGQQPPPGEPAGQAPSLQTQDPRGRIRTTVSLVVVPVTVKDSAGGLVYDLQQNDFRVFEDNVEQRIALFSVDAFPLSAAVLIDDDLKRSTSGPGAENSANSCGGIQRVRRGIFVALR